MVEHVTENHGVGSSILPWATSKSSQSLASSRPGITPESIQSLEDLQKLPFKAAYLFRPGYIQPMEGMKNTLSAYKVLGFLYPLFKTLFHTKVTLSGA